MYSSSQQDDEVSKLVRELRWEDTFFDQEEGIIAVFDFDHEKKISYSKKVDVASVLSLLICFSPFIISIVVTIKVIGAAALAALATPICFLSIIICMALCMVLISRKQIKRTSYSQHVAITHDGIKFVQDRHLVLCRENPKTSKTVPFDKIYDCGINEPEGSSFGVEHVLSQVYVDTGSISPGQSHELSLWGLKEPEKFTQLVWAMERATARGIAPTVFAVPVEAVAVPLQSSIGATAIGIEVSVAPSESVMDRDTTTEKTNAINANMKSTNK